MNIEEIIESISGQYNDFVHVIDNVYKNDLFGISFIIPNDWYIVNYNQFPKYFNQQTLVGEYEYYKDEIYKYIDQPSLFISKYDPNSDKYFGLVSPVLNFSIISKEPDYKHLNLEDYADLLSRSENAFGYHMLKKFRITNRGSIFQIGGFDSIICDTEYLFENKEIEFGIMVEMSILNIDYGDFFLDFSMTECKSQGQIVKNEFSELIKSIKLKE